MWIQELRMYDDTSVVSYLRIRGAGGGGDRCVSDERLATYMSVGREEGNGTSFHQLPGYLLLSS